MLYVFYDLAHVMRGLSAVTTDITATRTKVFLHPNQTNFSFVHASLLWPCKQLTREHAKLNINRTTEMALIKSETTKKKEELDWRWLQIVEEAGRVGRSK